MEDDSLPQQQQSQLYTQALRAGAEDGGENAAEIQQLAEALAEQGLDLESVAQEIQTTLDLERAAAENASESLPKEVEPEDNPDAVPSVAAAPAPRPRTPQRGSDGKTVNSIAARKSTPPRARASTKTEAPKKTQQQPKSQKDSNSENERKGKDRGREKKALPSKPVPRKVALEPWRDPNSAEYDPARVKANEAFAKAQEAGGATDASDAKKQKQQQQRKALEAKLGN